MPEGTTKYVVSGVEVMVVAERVQYYGKDGKLTFEWKSSEKRDEIHTCQPLADGNILIAQNGPSRLIEVNREGKINQGDLICMTSFGSGFTWGACVVDW